jgi:hypothetical protein
MANVVSVNYNAICNFYGGDPNVPLEGKCRNINFGLATKARACKGANQKGSLGYGESCESMFVRGSFVHQKFSNFALTNLLFGCVGSCE